MHDLSVLFNPTEESTRTKGFRVYMPVFQEIYKVPLESQEEAIKGFSERLPYADQFEIAMRAALEDCIYPFQETMLVIENGKYMIFITDLEQQGNGLFFDDVAYMKKYPSLESIRSDSEDELKDSPNAAMSQSDFEKMLNASRKKYVRRSIDSVKVTAEKMIGNLSSKGFGK